jgi:hypothetical protein
LDVPTEAATMKSTTKLVRQGDLVAEVTVQLLDDA